MNRQYPQDEDEFLEIGLLVLAGIDVGVDDDVLSKNDEDNPAATPTEISSGVPTASPSSRRPKTDAETMISEEKP